MGRGSGSQPNQPAATGLVGHHDVMPSITLDQDGQAAWVVVRNGQVMHPRLHGLSRGARLEELIGRRLGSVVDDELKRTQNQLQRWTLQPACTRPLGSAELAELKPMAG